MEPSVEKGSELIIYSRTINENKYYKYKCKELNCNKLYSNGKPTDIKEVVNLKRTTGVSNS
jgi:hypothetical protein